MAIVRRMSAVAGKLVAAYKEEKDAAAIVPQVVVGFITGLRNVLRASGACVDSDVGALAEAAVKIKLAVWRDCESVSRTHVAGLVDFVRGMENADALVELIPTGLQELKWNQVNWLGYMDEFKARSDVDETIFHRHLPGMAKFYAQKATIRDHDEDVDSAVCKKIVDVADLRGGIDAVLAFVERLLGREQPSEVYIHKALVALVPRFKQVALTHNVAVMVAPFADWMRRIVGLWIDNVLARYMPKDLHRVQGYLQRVNQVRGCCDACARMIQFLLAPNEASVELRMIGAPRIAGVGDDPVDAAEFEDMFLICGTLTIYVLLGDQIAGTYEETLQAIWGVRERIQKSTRHPERAAHGRTVGFGSNKAPPPSSYPSHDDGDGADSFGRGSYRVKPWPPTFTTPIPTEEMTSILQEDLGFKGNFASFADAPNPYLTLDGAGLAPFGKGERTIVDKDVRDTWEMDASNVQFRNPARKPFVDKVVREVCQTLAANFEASKPRAELYKLLVFLPHVDTEKANGMFASIVIVLPSEFTGGDVHTSHSGVNAVFNSSDNSLTRTTALSWYTDVFHEVKPITSGYRLALCSSDLINTVDQT
ncbi:Protein kinase domain-containing protein [Mycena kentingensis (nom. inval.)]|nr:Protein kinase domain-containing protein [Mycena kentingensis (nom. inval.)]